MAKSDEKGSSGGRITEILDSTFHSIELANEMIEQTSEARAKEALSDRNERLWAAAADRKK